jgi:hypothetical protein
MRSSPSTFPPGRVLLAEIGGAILGGIIVAPLAYFLVGFLFMGAGLGMGLLTVQFFGVIVGFGLGAGLGAGLVGNRMGQGGNIWIAMAAGAIVGLLAGPGAVLLLQQIGGMNVLGGIFILGIPLTLIAAVAGYNVRRRSV